MQRFLRTSAKACGLKTRCSSRTCPWFQSAKKRHLKVALLVFWELFRTEDGLVDAQSELNAHQADILINAVDIGTLVAE